MRDVLDTILKAEPAKPSTVRRQINDEVDTIVLKCLAKERERRYQTAGDLANDIERYLTGEPIEAKRASSWYVLRKTLVRNKKVASIAAAFFFGGAVVTGALSLRVYQLIHERESIRTRENELNVIRNFEASTSGSFGQLASQFGVQGPSKFDFNRDGYVDLYDFGLLERALTRMQEPLREHTTKFLECYSGDRDGPLFERPSITCQGKFDSDSDGDVDFVDFVRSLPIVIGLDEQKTPSSGPN